MTRKEQIFYQKRWLENAKKKKYILLMSQNNSNREKQVILLVILNGKKREAQSERGWYYLAVRKLSALLSRITSKYHGDL